MSAENSWGRPDLGALSAVARGAAIIADGKQRVIVGEGAKKTPISDEFTSGPEQGITALKRGAAVLFEGRQHIILGPRQSIKI